ncbi:MAG: sigma-54-dependent Fis family transcriptional regulator [Bacteroidetes bacterium]|nr:sigma-54-dependent Fis family transcriptional regulator [Bacteroidota bacterium]
MTIQDIKLRFGIIGSSLLLDRAIDIAKQVAPTDLTVLVTGESGSGKEVFPQIIHQLSTRKHGQYIAVNCGAIPEGTIDSELLVMKKGSFTGAHEARKGYFEMVSGGTIFLDEVAELPLSTQARLLRVLETGEFIKVGSSKVLKTDVRIIAATNVNIPEAIHKGRFREDLYYRLNTVPIKVPALRERKEDIHLLFRKFASDFASKYRMPSIKLTGAESYLENYSWPGNVRQLKNIAEQISVIEKKRDITPEILVRYLPVESNNTLPILVKGEKSDSDFNERDILYKVLFDMKKELDGVKKLVADIIQGKKITETDLAMNADPGIYTEHGMSNSVVQVHHPIINNQQPIHEIEESLSLEEKEKDFIKKALERHKGKRKNAAKELGISERTLYRKINEYKIPG